MKVVRVEIENLGPYVGKHEFVIPDGLTAILGKNLDEPGADSNGSGKSFLVEPLDWVPFGEVPRGDHVDSIVHDGSEFGRGLVEYVDGPDSIVIERTRNKKSKKTALTLTVNDQDLTAMDLSETQRIINHWLGVDRQLFHASVFFGQSDDWSFAEAKDKERLDIMKRIHGLDQLDQWLANAKAIKSELPVDLIGQITQLRAQRDAEAQHVQHLEGQAHQNEVNHAEATKQLNDSIAWLSQAEQEVARLQGLYAETANLLDLIPFHQANNTATTTVSTLRTRLAREQATLAKYQESPGACITCGQDLPKHTTNLHIDEAIVKVTATFDELRRAEADQAQTFAALGAAQVQRANQEQAQRNQLMEIGRLETVMTQINGVKASLPRMESSVAQWVRTVADMPMVVASKREAVRAMDAQISELETQQSTITQQHAVIDFWIKALGTKGIISYVLDSKLNELTDEANEHLTAFTNGTTWVRVETQTKTRKGTLNNKINVRVFRANPDGSTTERNYRSWSGGERYRIGFAVDLAVHSMIHRRAAKQWDLLVLDEVFRHLDARGREQILSCLRKVARKRGSVLIIDHDPDMNAMFKQKVVVERRDGASRITETP